jgi:hypothetical protein
MHSYDLEKEVKSSFFFLMSHKLFRLLTKATDNSGTLLTQLFPNYGSFALNSLIFRHVTSILRAVEASAEVRLQHRYGLQVLN